ncbi:MAG: endolytic transglycosylase MltG [Patescibacteria group bacterium]
MRRFFLTFLSFFLIAGCIASGIFTYSAWFSREIAGLPVNVTIPDHATVDSVAQILHENGLVSFAFEYRLYGFFDAHAAQAKAGTYTFRKGASFARIAELFFRGPGRVERSVRLVEGKMIDENLEALAASRLDAKPYEALAGKSMNAEPYNKVLLKDYPFLLGVPPGQSLEGYLFPDTYSIYEDDIASLVHKQLDQFESVVNTVPNETLRMKTGMTWHQVLTIASIVQDEVRSKDEMKTVAGIFLNRLHASMPLQSDATINYIVRKGNARATSDDLNIDSPYNTYKYPGLPPGPIGNPGLDAIQAVLNPTASDYVYFLTDNSGKVYYAKTFTEHVANKRAAFGQ